MKDSFSSQWKFYFRLSALHPVQKSTLYLSLIHIWEEYKEPCSCLYVRDKKALLFEVTYYKNRINSVSYTHLDVYKRQVYANIGNLSDVGAVLQNDAGGIGLFRSEFLYLESETFPTEEPVSYTHLDVYKRQY